MNKPLNFGGYIVRVIKAQKYILLNYKNVMRGHIVEQFNI